MRAIVPFRIQQTWVAIEAGHVREVLGEREWIQIPSNAPQIPGILSWQGRAIALFDLGTLGGALRPLQPGQRRPRTLVVDVSGAMLALPVDGVMEVEEIDDSLVQACRVTRLGNCSAEVELRGRPMPLLNLNEAMNGILASPG
jgi:chemotaxis signal transduction protein